jgi:hypothetical protein
LRLTAVVIAAAARCGNQRSANDACEQRYAHISSSE